MADPYINPAAASSGQQPLIVPAQDRRTTLLHYAQADPMLTPAQKAELVTWLQGQGSLTDPALYTWVTRGGGSAQVPGAGPVQTPQQPAPASASAPSTQPQGVGGEPGAGGLYQNYIANQQKAAARPLVGVGGRAVGPQAGDNVTPPSAPPVAPNAVNPTAPAAQTTTPKEAPIMATQPTVPGGGPLSTTTGSALLGPNALPDVQLREAVRQGGYDPNGGGLAAQYFAKLIQPVLAAEGSLYGFGQQGGADYTQAGNFIGNLVKSFTTAGQNGYAGARQFAQNIMGSPNFSQSLNDVGDYKQQQQILQNMMPLLYGGSSGLEQAAAQANMDRGMANYQDAAFGLGGQPSFGGNFTQYMAQTPQGQAIARLLGFGG